MIEGRDPLPGMLAAGRFEPYVRHIRFPHFRNLRDGIHIDFNYPVTALVGPNGTNKTAVLRALQGCPDQTNIGLYWFSTNLDPIRVSKGARHRFIHGYLAPSTGEMVEVIKSRIARTDPDYFEPARPIVADGMARMPPLQEPIPPERTRTRWKAISKAVVYLDFRSELSAFDKYFFHTPFTKRVTSLVGKKKFVRQRSRHLAASMDGRPSFIYYGSERILEPARELDSEQADAISRILGRRYESIRVLRHRFFNDDGYSVLLREPHLRYSEAFAGSGEFAVAMLVRGITEAPECSLILLDEPEVSLHPGAQRELMAFIREQAKLRHHQFVISTHAPEVVRDLPDEAIKVFRQHPVDGKVDLISQASPPSEAFFQLGVPTTDKRRVYVEDGLAAAVVKRAIRALGSSAHEQLEVQVLPGGAGAIQTRIIPAFALSHAECLVILDGDQRAGVPRTSGEIADAELRSTVKDLLGGVPQLSLSGGVDGHSVNEENRQFRWIIEWVRQHVAYLPGNDPESLLLELLGEKTLPGGAAAAKQDWEYRTRQSLGRADYESVSSIEILAEQDRALARVESSDPLLKEIITTLKDYLH